MRFKLFLSVLFFCGITKAQTNTVLKDFINKNDIAVRGVQKNSIKLTDQANEIYFKELLKFQIASVKFFDTDPEKSIAMAYLIREKCVDFLSKNYYPGPFVYFNLSDKETLFFSTRKPLKDINSYFNKSEDKVINAIDVKNPHLFDDFITRIK